MKNLAFEIKDDKSLWERMDIPNVGEVLLVENSYYDGIVEGVEKLQQEIDRLKKELEEAKEERSFFVKAYTEKIMAGE